MAIYAARRRIPSQVQFQFKLGTVLKLAELRVQYSSQIPPITDDQWREYVCAAYFINNTVLVIIAEISRISSD